MTIRNGGENSIVLSDNSRMHCYPSQYLASRFHTSGVIAVDQRLAVAA